jgi:hypothetical protein
MRTLVKILWKFIYDGTRQFIPNLTRAAARALGQLVLYEENFPVIIRLDFRSYLNIALCKRQQYNIRFTKIPNRFKFMEFLSPVFNCIHQSPS